MNPNRHIISNDAFFIGTDRMVYEVRARSHGYMTATEVLLLSGAPLPVIEERLGLWMLPALCGPWGKVMP